MANGLEGRVDKLSEAVGVLGERVARLEHEQRATRSSVDQLIGEVCQFDKRLGDMSTQFDKRLGDMNTQFDKRLFVMGTNVWREEQEWPLARTQYTRYYLHSRGRANSQQGLRLQHRFVDDQ